jgi:hypothetical protein
MNIASKYFMKRIPYVLRFLAVLRIATVT